MRIAVAQLNTQAGDFSVTEQRMVACSLSAADQQVDLLVFPLATLTGTHPVDFTNKDRYLKEVAHVLARLCREVACPCLVPLVAAYDLSFPEAVLLNNGEAIPLFRYRSSGEGAAVPATFEVGSKRFGLAYNYADIDAYIDAHESLDVLIYAQMYGYALDDAGSAMGSALNESRFAADAVALDAWIVGAGSLGGSGLGVQVGASFVLAPSGQLAGSAPAFEESLLVVGLEASHDGTLVEPQEYEIYNRSLFLWESLTLALHDYVARQDLADVALAYDGSLASCVLTVLATDALGPRHVHVLVDEGLQEQADEAIWSLPQALHANVSTFDLAALARDATALDADDGLAGLPLANLAREAHALPLAAYDKTYLAVEAQALWLHVAELLPLGDVYRTDLIELAHMRNTISPIIPQSAFSQVKVPEIKGLAEVEATPVLRLQRLDVTLATAIEWEKALPDIISRRGEPEVTQEIVHMLWDCATARLSYPPCMAMSSKPLRDLVFPLHTSWRDDMREEQASEEEERIAASLLAPHSHDTTSSDLFSSFDTPSAGLSSFLEGLGAEVVGSLPQGISESELQSALGDLIGLIQDMGPEAGIDPNAGNLPLDGPLGPLTWGSPFSEN